jgi:predicted RNA binding protein YcfA (HicA-like mRNA interferase family)
VSKKRKLLEKVLSGSKNIRFDDFVTLLESFGFIMARISGSHHIFKHSKVQKSFPIQPQSNGQAKPYQIKQFLDLVEENDLKFEDDNSKENGS